MFWDTNHFCLQFVYESVLSVNQTEKKYEKMNIFAKDFLQVTGTQQTSRLLFEIGVDLSSSLLKMHLKSTQSKKAKKGNKCISGLVYQS